MTPREPFFLPKKNSRLEAFAEPVNALFARYTALAAKADDLFNRVKAQFPEAVTCPSLTGQAGQATQATPEGTVNTCASCCHALFDLSLIEAFYLHTAFTRHFGFGPVRSRILEAAGHADRLLTKEKHLFFQMKQKGHSDAQIMEAAAKTRIACPLLDKAGFCALYDWRPITCRLYGIPSAIGGKAHVCPHSGFGQGAYPTVQLDRIQDSLSALSQELVLLLSTRFRELNTVYVPVSMALLTNYDDLYFGLAESKPEDR